MLGKAQKGLSTIQENLNETFSKNDFVVYFTRSQKYTELKAELFKDAEIVYENYAGGILKYKYKGDKNV